MSKARFQDLRSNASLASVAETIARKISAMRRDIKHAEDHLEEHGRCYVMSDITQTEHQQMYEDLSELVALKKHILRHA